MENDRPLNKPEIRLLKLDILFLIMIGNNKACSLNLEDNMCLINTVFEWSS